MSQVTKPTAGQPDDLPLDRLDLGDGDTLDLERYLKHDYDDVSAASQELPAMLEWVHAKLQAMTEQKLLTDQAVDQARALAWFALQGDGDEGFRANYAGKPTSEALNHAVNLDPNVRKLERHLAGYAGWTQRLNNLRSSIQAKLDLVRSSEATRRRVFDAGTDQ